MKQESFFEKKTLTIYQKIERLLDNLTMIKVAIENKKTVWKTVGTKRNEPLDIRNYAYATLKIANPNLNKKYGYEVTQSKPVIRKRRTISKGI